MNDEYLWDKTGVDPEIEKLEKALAVFRYREALPSAPITNTADERAPRWKISLAFAFASFAAVAVLSGTWFQMSDDKSNSENVPEFVFVAGPESPALSSPQVAEPTPQPVPSVEAPAKPTRIGRRKINPTTASLNRRFRAEGTTTKDSVASLTPEEKYAYRQLMLALSITGSKLKIVQNTIDGTGDTEDNDNKNQR